MAETPSSRDVAPAFERVGSGEPVVLLHGVTTSSFIWRRIVPLLSPHYDVIAIDHLGFGGSPRDPGADASVGAHAERAAALLRRLALGPVHLVGHDVGGAIAQVVTARYPEQVRDLALLNTVGYDYWPVQPISSLRAPIIRRLSVATLNRHALAVIVRRGLFYKERLTPELLELFHSQVSAPEARKSFMQFIRALDPRSTIEALPRLAASGKEVLIVRGDGDVYLTENIAERLHEDLPGSRLVRIPTAGHFLQEDEPELVSRVLIEFFRRHD